MVASKSFIIAAVAGAAAVSAMNGTVVTTTKVVSKYTTYCPEATTFCLGSSTYTVTAPTTLTITDCPCTITEPCYTCGVPTSPPTPITGVVPPPNTEVPAPPPVHTQAVVPTQPILVTGGVDATQAQLGFVAAAGLAVAGFLF